METFPVKVYKEVPATPTEATKEPERHLGVMRVSMAVLADAFLLPSDYRVVSAHIDTLTNELHVLLSHPTLPPTGEYQQLPTVSLAYTATQLEDGRRIVSLTNVRVTTYPDIATTEFLAPTREMKDGMLR